MSESAYSTEGFTRHETIVNGISHVWWEIGAENPGGDPCVYFHGGGTFHGFEWARDWAGSFRMILPHHPNFGESADADFKSVDDYMAHYRSFFAEIGLDRFRLVGASMGGHFASTYAARNPSQVAKLVLVSPGGLRHPDAPMPDFASIPPEEHRLIFAADAAWVDPFWPLHPDPEWMALRMREATASFRVRADPDATYATLLRDLATLKMPTLLLWGELDRMLLLPLLDEWLARIPHAQSVVIPGGSHLLLDEFPAARVAALDFLKG
ncbi:MAG TPA: alpha/beta hydrolase [Sphingobium sp.]